MYIAFAIIVIDLIGFGMMVPIFAFYALNLGATPATATLLMSLYAVAMFCTTPLLGRLSDFYGRRPVLMISMLGATVGYLILANAHALWMIALARIISGAMAGNLAAAQAYMTDITTEKDRAKAMGLIGAGFGLGFIIGPTLGSFLAGDNFESANLILPAYVSAALSFAAFLAVLFALPESLDKANRDALRAQPKVNRFKEIVSVLKRPIERKVIASGVIYSIAAGFFETIFPIWASYEGANLVSGPQGLVPFLLVGGISLTIMQVGLVGPLSRKFGEHTLIKAGAVAFGGGLLLMSFAAENGWTLAIYLLMGIVSACGALIMTCIQSLMSQCAGATERGMVMGVYNSLSTLGRVIGTVMTGTVFTYLYVHAPYFFAAGMMVMLFIMAAIVQRRWSIISSDRASVAEK